MRWHVFDLMHVTFDIAVTIVQYRELRDRSLNMSLDGQASGLMIPRCERASLDR